MKNILLLFVIIFQLLSCESNKREPMKYDKYRKYVWQSEVVVPSGYPAAVYGSFYTKKDAQDAGMSAPIGLGGELVRGNHDVPFPCWEICGPAVSDDYMSLDNPRRLPEAFNVTWMSFVDGYEYHCEGDIDTEKIQQLMEEGYPLASVYDSTIRKEDFNGIRIGLAPGGVVILWVKSSIFSLEIARYQATKKRIEFVDKKEDWGHNGNNSIWMRNYVFEKYTLPKNKLLLRNDDFATKLTEPVTLEDVKNVPYGIWDKWHQRYPWKIKLLTTKDTPTIRIVAISCFNAEEILLLGDRVLRDSKIEYEVQDKHKLIHQPPMGIPSKIYIDWYAKDDIAYYLEYQLNESELSEGFAQAFQGQENTEGELIIEVNQTKSNASLRLQVGEKVIWFPNSYVRVGKSGKQI
ncbi:DUF2931 family protein [Capnocytophaga canimorsus]|uniref:DUF2931 family protein n=1 Tax=Capnocytophaga canimorsus TaxID=28188 RepID=UPI0037D7111A